MLAAAFRANQFAAVGIDRAANRHCPSENWVRLDLWSGSGQAQALGLLDDPCVAYAWFGVPCTTAARSEALASAAAELTPLRTKHDPSGAVTVARGGRDAARVQYANCLYEFVAHAAAKCKDKSIMWTVENPANSLLWWTPRFLGMLQWAGVVDVIYEECAHGGRRKKRQRLRGNAPLLELAKLCPGGHSHPPWIHGGRSAVAEAQYPAVFCSRVVAAVSTRMRVVHDARVAMADSAGAKCNAAAAAATARPSKWKLERGAERAAAGDQPRVSVVEPLVTEYWSKYLVRSSTGDAVIAAAWLAADAVSRQGRGWVREGTTWGQVHPEPGHRLVKVIPEGGSGDQPGVLAMAVPWPVRRFYEQARLCPHPFARAPRLPDRTLRAVFAVLTQGPARVAQVRERTLGWWRQRAGELQPEEDRIFAAAHPEVQPCLAGKRTLLLHEMLTAAGFPSPGKLVQMLRVGAPMFGEVPAFGCFDDLEFCAKKSIPEAMLAAPWVVPALCGSLRPSPVPGLDAKVYAKTLEEVKSGKAAGPFSASDLTQQFPSWLPARRLGIVQGEDVRQIDDFSEYGHNDTSATVERVDAAGVDRVVGLAKIWTDAVDERGIVSVQLESGEVLSGPVHPRFRSARARQPVGRSMDIEKAYKNVPVHPQLAPMSVVGLWSPESGRAEFFRLFALAFGARNSVFSFGAFGRAFDYILSNLFLLVVSQYVDDFPQVEPEAVADSAHRTAVEVLLLLGWNVKADGPKAAAFADSFTALGVVFSFAEVAQAGVVVVSNKQDRGARILEALEQQAQAPAFSPAAAASIRGKLQYARGQVFGGVGGPGLRALSRLAASPPAAAGREAQWLVGYWRAFFRDAAPRRVPVGPAAPPVLLFVDGAVEGAAYDDVSMGAVLIVPAESGPDRIEYFSAKIGRELVAVWRGGVREQVIEQAELAPCVAALTTWPVEFANRHVLVFVDNNGARAGIVKGICRARESAELVEGFWRRAAALGAFVWVERVPSRSNPADAPSRGSAPGLSAYEKRVAVRAPADWTDGGCVEW